ncbi:unnamed protein product [Polarella glacialis]|uniref:Protein kinase domain-containing protein n=1 Tax=Polarella glacialis TaxID=89957 RepID=A0A813DR44_POLGL|nr:unnamed protein product [Polarella glacialis]CAE8678663.1 unnamed protein product [Polarella glacialis]
MRPDSDILFWRRVIAPQNVHAAPATGLRGEPCCSWASLWKAVASLGLPGAKRLQKATDGARGSQVSPGLEPAAAALYRRFEEIQQSFDGLLQVPHSSFGSYFQASAALGKGGFGTVFCAEPTEKALREIPSVRGRTRFAVKRVNLPKRDADIEMIGRSFLMVSVSRQLEFLESMRTQQSADSNMIRNYVQLLEVPNTMYIVMDMLEGPTMRDWIIAQEHLAGEGVCSGLARQMLTALHFLHRVAGALHRDVKPENFGFASPVHSKSPLPQLKLFDLGLVWVLPAVVTEATASELLPLRVCGTTQWIAPETWMGTSGPPSDLWGVGLIVHILVFWCMPFDLLTCPDGAAARLALQRNTLNFATQHSSRQASEGSRRFIASLLHKDPRQRSTSNVALADPWLCGSGDMPTCSEQSACVLPERSLTEEVEWMFWHSLVHASAQGQIIGAATSA